MSCCCELLVLRQVGLTVLVAASNWSDGSGCCVKLVWQFWLLRQIWASPCLEGDDHRQRSSKHSRRSTSPYASDYPSGRTPLVLRLQCLWLKHGYMSMMMKWNI
ncbi:hypothetical protein TNCV_2091981 [Trichonephila clavipes]|nr:hypothetical protein TNCV_2091981 [Trichonephila clavipes]